MAHYIDGFFLPMARGNLGQYRQLVQAAAVIWQEHGALEYREYVNDDANHEGTRSFPELAGATVDEVVVFGWVLFESREARDTANAKVASDPRMVALMGEYGAGFDASRMAYGGFRPFVCSSDVDTPG